MESSSTQPRILGDMRDHPGVAALEGDRALGAEAYIQSLGGMTDAHPTVSPRRQRRLAWEYLLVTAQLSERTSPKEYLVGVKTARKVAKRLQRTYR